MPSNHILGMPLSKQASKYACAPSWHTHSRHLIPATQLYEIWCIVQLKIIFCLTVQYKMMQNKKNLLMSSL